MLFKQFVNFKQRNVDMFMISSTVENIIDNYKVEIYDQDTNKNGYQRSPIPAHYRDIAQYLITNTQSIFLPSAIIGAVDKQQITLTAEGHLHIKDPIRIVDGQHRIEGFKHAIATELKKRIDVDVHTIQQLHSFELPIILMVIDDSPQAKLNEVIAFIDINSKGKKVSTDLAIRLRNEMYTETHDYLKEEKKLLEKIATDITLFLTNHAQGPLWYKAIKTVPTDKGRIISINSFNKSLYPIIKNIIKLTTRTNTVETVETVETLVSHLQTFILTAWKDIHNQWPDCFSEDKTFDKDYNIQKGIGVHALHLILADCIPNLEPTDRDITEISKETLSLANEKFKQLLFQSPVEYKDWLSGGKFSGYNSGSGFSKVKNYVLTGSFIPEDTPTN